MGQAGQPRAPLRPSHCVACLVCRTCPTRTDTGMRPVSTARDARARWWTSPSPPRRSSCSARTATPTSTRPSARNARRPSCQVRNGPSPSPCACLPFHLLNSSSVGYSANGTVPRCAPGAGLGAGRSWSSEWGAQPFPCAPGPHVLDRHSFSADRLDHSWVKCYDK